MTGVINSTRLGMAIATAVASLSLTAAGQTSTTYHVTNLVADTTGPAAHTDAHLINPWGLSHGASTPWWVSDNGTGVSTLYDASGNPYPVANPLVVTIPTSSGTGTGTPTGTAFFSNKFVFVTQDGTISQWSSGTNAVKKVNHPGSVYTGCTVAKLNTVNTLYVANSAGGIEAYNAQFSPVTLQPGAFTDVNIPAGYTPYNVQSVGSKIFVTFSNGFPGPGSGYVDAFDASGNLLLSLQHGTWMNEPWGVVQTPTSFGKFSHALLVGQLGNGTIVAFNPSTGAKLGLMKTSTGTLVINGLWGLAFGNNGVAGPSTTLFFTAGPSFYTHGLFGSILPD
jgi:uncharacterized protein (TIGR03118 family)